jgi:hypothetical protein
LSLDVIITRVVASARIVIQEHPLDLSVDATYLGEYTSLAWIDSSGHGSSTKVWNLWW